MIKAAFFDVDGTLLSFHTHTVRDSAKKAIAKLQEKGILCIVATGRHMIQFSKLPVAEIPFDAFVMLNGQLVLDKAQNVLHGVPIKGKARDFLIEKFSDHTYPAILIEERDMYLNVITDHVKDVHRAISVVMPEESPYKGGVIYQVCAYLRPEEEHLVDPIAKDCVMTRWYYGGMDIIAGGGGKMAGIKWYLDHAGIAPEEIIAFGDAENDLDMLRFAGIGVAMGNADESVKAVADYITADIDDDGIEKALKHFNLI